MAKERGGVGLCCLVLRSAKPFTPWASSLTNLGRLPMLTMKLKAQLDLSLEINAPEKLKPQWPLAPLHFCYEGVLCFLNLQLSGRRQIYSDTSH